MHAACIEVMVIVVVVVVAAAAHELITEQPPLEMDDSEDDSFGCARSVVLIDFGRSIDLRSSITECSASLDSVAYLQQSQNDDNDAPANSYCCVNKVSGSIVV